MSVFVKNKSGIIHETTVAIAEELVGRGELVYVQEEVIEKPKAGRPKAE